MNVLVTGGAGFIGSHLTDRLIELGHQVTVIDNLLLGKKEQVNAQANFHQVDIKDFSAIEPLFFGMDAVFHLAADPRLPISIEDPISTHETNVTGTLNVLEAARKHQIKKFIFTSSCAVYGDQPLPITEQAIPCPTSPYGLHKLMGEQYVRLYHDLFGMATVSLRYFNVFGPRKTADGGYPMVIPVFLKQKKHQEVLTIVGDGEQTRDYVYVSDVVQANICALESQVEDGSAFNIGSGIQVSVNKIAELIGGESVHIPQRAGEMRFIQADNTKAKEKLSWEPQVKFETGLEMVKQWWLE